MVLLSLDESQQKLRTEYSDLEWLEKHEMDLIRFADMHLEHSGREQFLFDVYSMRIHPKALRERLEQELKSYGNPWYRLIKKLLLKRGKNLLVLGKRGAGKSYLAYYLAWRLHLHGEKVWILGPPFEYPEFVSGATLKIDNIPNKVTVIVDEASLQYFARQSQYYDQIEIVKKIAVMRHTGRNFIVVTQNLRLTDVGFAMHIDGIFFKTYALLQTEQHMERIKLHEQLKWFMPTKVNQALYYDNEMLLDLHIPLERWWKEKYSTPYRAFENESERYKFIARLHLDGLDAKAIAEQLSLKGTESNEVEIAKAAMVMESRGFHEILAAKDAARLVKSGWNDAGLNDRLKGKRKFIQGMFYLDPVEQESLKLQYADRPDFEIRSSFCMNEKFMQFLKERVQQQKANVMFFITGSSGTLTGSGKSWSSIALADAIYCLMGEEYDDSFIFFSEQDAMDAMKSRAERKVVIFEEARQQTSFGAGAGRIILQMQEMVQALRKRQISFIYNAPKEQGRGLYTHVLQTAGIDRLNMLNKLLLFDGNSNLLGYITLSAPEDWQIKSYDKRKEEYMNAVQEQRSSGAATLNLMRLGKEMSAKKDYYNATNRLQRLAVIKSYHPNLTEHEVLYVMAYAQLDLKRKF